jgi:hypothetical protein
MKNLLILISAMIVLPVRAEHQPEDIVVRELNFVRPADWKWKAPSTNSAAISQFIVPGESKKSHAEVRFYFSEKNFNAASKTWKKCVLGSDKPDNVEQQTVKIGGREIIYLKLNGTFMRSKKEFSGYTYVGAVIPLKKGFVHARILGPQAEVEKALGGFKKVIEQGVKDS